MLKGVIFFGMFQKDEIETLQQSKTVFFSKEGSVSKSTI
jgi:hypothetical protein